MGSSITTKDKSRKRPSPENGQDDNLSEERKDMDNYRGRRRIKLQNTTLKMGEIGEQEVGSAGNSPRKNV